MKNQTSYVEKCKQNLNILLLINILDQVLIQMTIESQDGIIIAGLFYGKGFQLALDDHSLI